MGTAGPSPELRIEELARAYRLPLAFPLRLVELLATGLLFLLAAVIARHGTDVARAGAACGFAILVLFGLYLRRRRRFRWSRPAWALRSALARVDAAHAGRAERAYANFRRLAPLGDPPTSTPSASGESSELAAHHLSRMLDRISTESVGASGRPIRKRLVRGAFVLFLVTVVLLTLRFLVVLEGVNVLFARGGMGPFPIAYVEHFSAAVELPAYLDGTGKKHVLISSTATVPQGSEVEVRVSLRVPSRRLLLTDGVREVPFVSDGHGGFVARLKAEDPVVLRVAARFGEVLLFDPNEILVSPLEDRAPEVFLAGAPSTRNLADISDLALDYTAMDDHGLAQVDLVIVSGQRTFRQELSQLDGQRKAVQGAHRLTSEHEMLRRAFLPVHVRIEARDANTATGPRWGKSRAITLIPEPMGQEVAERHIALRSFREALTTYLARDIQASHLSLSDAKDARKVAYDELRAAFDALVSKIEEGKSVPKHSLSFLEGQLEALERKGIERTTSESVLLAADALVQTIGDREAVDLAKDLGAAVEELAVQSRQLRFKTEGVTVEGVDDLLLGIKLGASQLSEVGALGLDLGSVAKGDLARIEATLQAQEYGKAEAASLHLAERLKRATPSFGAKGGAVEAGTPSSGSGGQGEGPASGAPQNFDDVTQEIDDLAQDAASELGELERLLREAKRAAEADFQDDPALDEALDELREALSDLPGEGMTAFGPRSDAATARSYGEAMAEALEARQFEQGLERGADAQEALKGAKEDVKKGLGWVDESALERADAALKNALDKAREAARRLSDNSDESVSGSLMERAQKQGEFAKRARDLAARGAEAQAPLPDRSRKALERAAELLEQAEQALRAGKGDEGTERASEAQSELERALPDSSAAESSSGGGGDEGSSQRAPGRAEVPGEERDRARDFRERVERGLGRSSGRLSPAVRRYAEELK